MRVVKVSAALLVAASMCLGSITGTVTDTSGKTPIPGALVRLEKGGQQDTTDQNGEFTLRVGTFGIGSRTSGPSSSHDISATTQRGLLRVTTTRSSALSITLFNLRGRTVWRTRETVTAGPHTYPAPHTAAGFFLYRIKTDGTTRLLRNAVSPSPAWQGGDARHPISVEPAPAKPTSAAARINDVMAVTKNGYLDYRVYAKNADTSKVTVRMIASAGTVTDVEGNLYNSVQIGPQIWTVENFRSTKFTDGSEIPKVTDSATWCALKTPAYCYYAYSTNADQNKKYGPLYNWYTVDPAYSKKIAPAGWHVPTIEEWAALETFLYSHGYNWPSAAAGNWELAKAMAAQTEWTMADTVTGTPGKDPAKNNATGLSAIPVGWGDDVTCGAFTGRGAGCRWWSSTQNQAMGLSIWDSYSKRHYRAPYGGFSIRLVKD